MIEKPKLINKNVIHNGLLCRHAYNKGIREKVAYLTCVVPDKKRPDYIATIDLDPDREGSIQSVS